MKKINIIIALSVFFISFQQVSYAQEEHGHDHDEESETAFELITSGLVSYSPSEKESVFGTEVHLTYWFNPKWGGGLSYSSKFTDDIVLSDVAVLGSYNALDWLTINTGANFALSKEGYREDTNVGLYLETEYNWRVSEFFHFGLLTGAVFSEETELTFGIQLGFEFPTHKH